MISVIKKISIQSQLLFFEYEGIINSLKMKEILNLKNYGDNWGGVCFYPDCN